MMTDALPILYSFRRCPYAMRARMALLISQQHCALREIVLRDKPDQMLEASPKGTVPVLVLPDGSVIDESFEVMVWALTQNDPENWLAAWTEDQNGTRDLIAHNDGPFKAHLDRYKYPTRYDGVDPIEERDGGVQFLQRLEDRLALNGHLSGPSRSIADMAIAPFIRQFANTDRDWFDSLDMPKLHAWLDSILSSQIFLQIMKKYPVWQPGDAEPIFAEAL